MQPVFTVLKYRLPNVKLKDHPVRSKDPTLKIGTGSAH